MLLSGASMIRKSMPSGRSAKRVFALDDPRVETGFPNRFMLKRKDNAWVLCTFS
jgi:hypothetical protein